MKLLDIKTRLQETSYPGRGIILGRTADDAKVMIAYFIMGRSVNSRNRIFELTEDGIRTKAYDDSKMEDPSLIIYHPVRVVGNETVVTNGDQTDTIRDFLVAGKTFEESLRTREFEPDGPNYTPRISGLVAPDGSYKMSILKSMDGDPPAAAATSMNTTSPRQVLHTLSTPTTATATPCLPSKANPNALHWNGQMPSPLQTFCGKT